jgi:S1-C subfamily serine protease
MRMTKSTHQEQKLNPQDLLRSVVLVEATIPEDSFTAPMLGTERSGSGVVINENGLVLTIGYIIAEAENVRLTTSSGRKIDAHPLAYDQETGFGLVQALSPLDLPALTFGDSDDVQPGDEVFVAGVGEVIEGRLLARQEFAGYWEYLLDEALFTAPIHPSWGGAALVGGDGRLLGIGSLQLQAATTGGTEDINMVVPISLLPPILDRLVSTGRSGQPARPWLGLYSADHDGEVTVINVDPRGPAAKAGVQSGDIIRDVRDQAVESLAEFYREVWASGSAGAEIPIRIVRDGREQWLRIRSEDRSDLLRKPTLQ